MEDMCETLQNRVHEMISDLVRMSVDEIDVDENLLELGADSILITELNGHIKNEFDVEIPLNLYFSDTTSVAEISRYVSEHMSSDWKTKQEAEKDSNESRSGVFLEEYQADISKKDTQSSFIICQPDACSVKETSLINLLQQQVQLINNQLILLKSETEHIASMGSENSSQRISPSDNKFVSQEKKEVTQVYQNDRKNAYVPFKTLNLEKKQFSEERNSCLKKVQQLYIEKTKSSKAYAAEYRKPYADCRSVSGFRPNMKEMCYQLIFKSSEGAYITDIDDNQYVDLAMDFGVSLFGHNQGFINDAICEEMKKGYPLSLVSGLSGEVAAIFCELTGMERAAFFNSGTEAVMVAVRIARAYTNKKKIVIFAGSYHGTFDGVLGMSINGTDKSTPIANGILQEYVNDLVILDYGCNEALEYIEKNKDQIAAVLVESVQSRRPDLQPHEFVHSLRDLTEKEGIILIFDEMILGFRLGKGGGQGFYEVQADLAAYGKICGGGMPIGIVAGKEKYMNCIDGGLWNYGDESYPPDEDKRTFVAGTFCHHPLTMAASKAVLSKIAEMGDELYQDINKKTEYLCTSLNQYFSENSIPIEMSYCGSLFRFLLKGNLELFYYLLNLKGVYIWEGRNCFISASHTYDDLDKVIDAVKWACNELNAFFDKRNLLAHNKNILCSKEQQEIIAFEQMAVGAGMNETCLVRVKGTILKEQLEKAYKQICQRHEILKYHLSEDMMYFVENEMPSFEVLFGECAEDSIMSSCSEIAKTPFDLKNDMLIRLHFFEVGEEVSYIFLSAHHVLVDGWSISVILQEIIEVYNAFCEHRKPKIREVMDYSMYLHNVNEIPVSQQQLRDMKEYYEGGFEYLKLPESDENIGADNKKIISENNSELLSKIRNGAKKLKCSTFVFLLSGFQSMLHFVTNKNFITVGIPYAGQQKFIMNSLVGNCTKVNKLKVYMDAATSMGDIAKNNKSVLKLYAETFGRDFDEECTLGETANIIFNVDKISNIGNFKDTVISLVPTRYQDTAYDLFINVNEFNDNIIFETVYNSEKYSETMVRRWMEVYYEILNQLANNTSAQLCDFDIVTMYDRKMTLNASEKLKAKEVAQELNILPELYDFDDENIVVTVKNKRRQPVITGSYGYLYIGRTIFTGFATDYIGRILHSGKLEVLGKECDCFIRNGKLVGCYAIKEKLKELSDFSYLDVEYDDGDLIVYFDSVNPEETAKRCYKSLNIIDRPDKFYLCTSHNRNIMQQISLNCFEGNDTERMIYEKLSEILQNKNISLDDNILDYGLTSLKLIHLIAELQDIFEGIPISIAELDGAYTIRGLGKVVDKLKTMGKTGILAVRRATEVEEGILSSAQRRMYVLNKLHPEDVNYNLPYLIAVDGVIDENKLQVTVEKCMEMHPMLRCRFYEEDGVVKYRTDDSTESKIKWESYSGEETEEEYIAHKKEEFVVPFSLLESSLFRMLVVNFKKSKSIIFVDFHHIIFDGMSANILIKDLSDLYNGNQVEKSDYLYHSYVSWQEELEKTEFYQDEFTYWKNRLNTNYPALDILRNHPLKEDKYSGLCGESILNLPAKITQCLKDNAKQLGCTVFSMISAAASLMLSLYSGEKEFAIGTVVEGRNNIAFHNIIGMFVNTIPLIQNIDDTFTIEEFIKKINQNNLDAFANSDVSFEKIVELAKVKVVKDRNPLFDFLITYHDNEITEISLDGINAEIIEVPITTNRFELELVVNCKLDNITLKLLYAKQLYGDENIGLMMKTLGKILENFSRNMKLRLDEMQYCDVIGLKRFNSKLDRTCVNYPKQETVVSIFLEQVKKWSDKIAVVFQEEAYTYKQLNERSNQLANTLLEKGIKKGELVAIVTERSLEMIVGMIAIIKVGCAYVPIDPIYPKERRNYIVEDSNVSFVLRGTVEIECSEDKEIMDLFSEISYSENKENPKVDICPEDALYVIYTSGTTGRPKGVLIEHKNVIRLMRNDEFEFDFDENDCWTMFHSICFDFSVWEMYGALLYGGKLVIPTRDITQNSNDFLELLKKEHVTILNQVPSAFYQLMRADEEGGYLKLQSLRYLIFGGEALDPGRLLEWHQNHKNVRIINMYGITETTVHVTYKEIGKREILNGISDIGSAIPTLGIYIMRGNQLCDISMPGEICVYGQGLGRGYLNREELTAEKFVANPYGDGRLYRSGDLARLLPTGGIEYLGRIDQQIKIRGFRIELEEIDAALRELAYVQDAVVIIKESVSGENAIHAYIVSGQKLDFNSVRQQLKMRLPDYMIPAYFFQIEKIPLTLNGKLNRKELPDILLPSGQAEEPRNEVEKKVKDMFIKVLNIKEIGIYDNFFEYGGHSLKAVEVLNYITKEFGVSISLDSLFSNGTIEKVSEMIKEKINEQHREQKPEPVAVEGVTEGVLSLNQKELYGATLISQNPEVYNICYPIILNNIQPEVVKETIKILFERHSILRTQLFEENNEVLQRIMSVDDCMENVYKYMQKENEIWNRDKLEKFINVYVGYKFRMLNNYLMRIHLINMDGNRYLLIYLTHHIISDAWSFRVFLNDFISVYSSVANGKKIELDKLPIQYIDYSLWQRDMLETDGFMQKEAAYWSEVLNGELPKVSLHTDFERKFPKNTEGSSIEVSLSKEQSEQLRKISVKHQGSVFTAFVSCINILMYMYTGQNDLILGTTAAGRNHWKLESQIGYYLNILPIRTKFEVNATIEEVIEATAKACKGAFENQDYPYEKIVSKVRNNRGVGKDSLFDILVQYINWNDSLKDDTKMEFEIVDMKSEQSKFDLVFNLVDIGGQTKLILEYCTKLFRKETIESMVKRLQTVIQVVLKEDNVNIDKITYQLTPKEDSKKVKKIRR